MKKLFKVRPHSIDLDVVLLAIRIVCGFAFTQHGWGKIQAPFTWMGPDSPVPGFLQGLAALAEFGGGIAWILGLLTPIASIGIAITMAVAVFMHAVVMGDPFVNMSGGGSYEPATMFFLISILLLVGGPGRFSLDRKIFGTR